MVNVPVGVGCPSAPTETAYVAATESPTRTVRIRALMLAERVSGPGDMAGEAGTGAGIESGAADAGEATASAAATVPAIKTFM